MQHPRKTQLDGDVADELFLEHARLVGDGVRKYGQPVVDHLVVESEEIGVLLDAGQPHGALVRVGHGDVKELCCATSVGEFGLELLEVLGTLVDVV